MQTRSEISKDYAELLQEKDTKRKKVLLLKKCQKQMAEHLGDLNTHRYLHGELVTSGMKIDAHRELELLNLMLSNIDEVTIYRVYRDGKLIHTNINTSDIDIYSFMHRYQSQSVQHATRYEGYKITCQKLDQNEEVKYI